MSKFFKALKQAEADRVRQEEEDLAPPAPAAREPLLLRPSSRMEPAGDVDARSFPVEPAPALAPPAAPAPPAAAAAPAVTQSVPPSFAGVEAAARPVPPYESNGKGAVEEHLVALLAPTSFETEQYRTLRTLLDAKRADGGPAVIAISSPAVGDGKTTTAINLAAVLAESEGSRVLLIDGDLRNPSVAAKLGLPPSGAGLTQALRGPGATLDSLITRRQPFNIDVLLAGQSSNAPYELLKSTSFARLLQEARRRYEFVIVDTPPIVALPDCRLICGLVDGFIIVVAAHRTPKKMVEEALNGLQPEKVLGFIFNSDEQPLSGYRYYYPYGETYGSNGRRRGGKGENA